MLKGRRRSNARCCCCNDEGPNDLLREKIQRSLHRENSWLEAFETPKKYFNGKQRKDRSQTGDGSFRNARGKLDKTRTFPMRERTSNAYEETSCCSSSDLNLTSNTRRVPRYKKATFCLKDVREEFGPEDGEFRRRERQASFCPSRKSYSSLESRNYDPLKKRRPGRPHASSTVLCSRRRNRPNCLECLGKLQKYYAKREVAENPEVTEVTNLGVVVSSCSPESWSSSGMIEPIATSSQNPKNSSIPWDELSIITRESSEFKMNNPEEASTSRYSTQGYQSFIEDVDLDSFGISSYEETTKNDLKKFDYDEECRSETTEEEPFTRNNSTLLFQSSDNPSMQSPVNRCRTVNNKRTKKKKKKSEVEAFDRSYLDSRSLPRRYSRSSRTFLSPGFLSKSRRKPCNSTGTTSKEFKYGTSGAALHFSEEKPKKSRGKFDALEETYDIQSDEKESEGDRYQGVQCWCTENVSQNKSYVNSPWKRSTDVDDESPEMLSSTQYESYCRKCAKLKENCNDISSSHSIKDDESPSWRSSNAKFIHENRDQVRHDVSKESSGYFREASSNERMQLEDLHPDVSMPDHWRKCEDHLSKLTNEYRLLTSRLKSMQSAAAEEVPALRGLLRKRITRRYPSGKEFSFEVKTNPKNSKINNLESDHTPKSLYHEYEDPFVVRNIHSSCSCVAQTKQPCKNYSKVPTRNLSRILRSSETGRRKDRSPMEETEFKKPIEAQKAWERDPVRTLESFCQRVKAINGRETCWPTEPIQHPPSRCSRCHRCVLEDTCSCIIKTSETRPSSMGSRKISDTSKTRCCSSRTSEDRNEQAYRSNEDKILIFPPGDEEGPPLSLFKNSSNIDCRVKGNPETGFRYNVTYTQQFVSSSWRPKGSDQFPPSKKMKSKQCQCCMDHG